MIKKLEVLANIAVIVTSVVLCSALVRRYFFSGNKQTVAAPTSSTSSAYGNTPSRRTPQPGTKISLPGIDWSKSSRTVVLALSTTCHFCNESAPFYQNLAQQKPGNVSLIAVFPQPVEDSRNYLNKLGVRTTDVVQSSLRSIGASGTPTLLLVDNNGSITASWVGKLSDSEAASVIEQIRQ
ncbi:MAG: TlpA family protein disulfide reductase [Pyrinomonadaceae bacterium]